MPPRTTTTGAAKSAPKAAGKPPAHKPPAHKPPARATGVHSMATMGCLVLPHPTADQAAKACKQSTANLDKEITAQHKQLNSFLREVKTLQANLDSGQSAAVLRAWFFGRLLNERRKRMKHGDWLPYLKKRKISSQAASQYCRIAEVDDPKKLPSTITRTIAALPTILGKPEQERKTAAKPKSEPAPAPAASAPPVYVPAPDSEPEGEIVSDGEKIRDVTLPEFPEPPAGFAVNTELQAKIEEQAEKIERLEEQVSILEADAPEELKGNVDRVIKEKVALRKQVDKLQADLRTAHSEIRALKKIVKANTPDA